LTVPSDPAGGVASRSPGVDMDLIRTTRVERPETIRRLLQARARRPFVRGDGRLLIVAADHTARGVFTVGTQRDVMSDRGELLRRLMVALSRPGVDGVLATSDILEDLAILGALNDKLAIGAVNRGGLAGSSFEIDDRLTGYDVASLVRSGLDGGKVLLRICLEDEQTAGALERTAALVDAAAEAGMRILVEPFMAGWVDGKLRTSLDAASVAHSVAISSGLGGSSAYTWLKIPVVAEMERVVAATTLPMLLLGGDSPSDPERTYATWADALHLPGVRGLVVGRSMLYPNDGDVAANVDIAARLVHER
jgi:DhnA family fructose-bisphosphate aldolase class Ia